MFHQSWGCADVNTEEYVERKDFTGLLAPEEEKINV